MVYPKRYLTFLIFFGLGCNSSSRVDYITHKIKMLDSMIYNFKYLDGIIFQTRNPSDSLHLIGYIYQTNKSKHFIPSSDKKYERNKKLSWLDYYCAKNSTSEDSAYHYFLTKTKYIKEIIDIVKPTYIRGKSKNSNIITFKFGEYFYLYYDEIDTSISVTKKTVRIKPNWYLYSFDSTLIDEISR